MKPQSICYSLTAILLSGFSMSLFAADHRDRYEGRTFENEKGEKLPYRLLRPKNYESQKGPFPVVLFLHGAGERGNDNQKQLVHGLNDFASDENMEKYPCFVVAPQCPEGKLWVDVEWSADFHTMPQEPAAPMRLSLELLEGLAKEFRLDAGRHYITGLSMGGYGVWDAISRHPNLFAAAVPVCGGGDTALAEKIKAIPIWAFHGAEDGAVKPKRSRDMIAALKKAGGNPLYTEYEKVGHDSWVKAYSDPKMFAWLFEQKRKLSGPPPGR